MIDDVRIGEAAALFDEYEGRYGELTARASAAEVAETVRTPCGFGMLDAQLLLRERFWLPDPRRVEVEGGWASEIADLDIDGNLVSARVLDAEGQPRLDVIPIRGPDGAEATAWFFAGKLVEVRFVVGARQAPSAVISAGPDAWWETYEYTAGLVTRVVEHGLVLGAEWAGFGEGRDLAVSHTAGGEVEAITDVKHGLPVYRASSLEPREEIAKIAAAFVAGLADRVPPLSEPVERLLVLYEAQDELAPHLLLLAPQGERVVVQSPVHFDPTGRTSSPFFDELRQQASFAGLLNLEEAVARVIAQRLASDADVPFERAAEFTVVVEPRAESLDWARR